MSGDENVNVSLIRAVREGRVERARELIDSFGLSYSQHWAKGYVLLCDALKHKRTEVAKLLLTSGSKVNSKNSRINPCDTALHLAVEYGDMEIVDMILDKGGDIDAKNQSGKTPLHVAIAKKRMEIVQLLFKHRPDLSVCDRAGTSFLHVAAQTGCFQTVEHLLSNGAYVNCVCTSQWNKGYAPLHFAVESGNNEVITLLLNSGAIVDGKVRDSLTPLHIAAEKGHARIAEELLKHGACIHSSTSSKSYTPLHIATVKGREAVVKLLLQHGAKVDDEDTVGKTTLYHAVENGCLTIVEDLLKYCPDINNQTNISSFKMAVQGSKRESQQIVEAMLEYGFIVDPKDANDSKLLHAAVEKGNLKIIEDLLKYGADVHTLNESKFTRFTPLHTAAKNKQKKVAELLISYGADINARDKNGQTPIFYAIQNADLKSTKLLLTNGAYLKDDPELLSIAVEKKCIEIVEALLQLDVDINASDKYGRTALHFTAFNQNEHSLELGSFTYLDPNITTRVEIAKLLLSKGANVNFQTVTGATTLHAATQKEYAKVVEALLEYNANVNSVAKDDITPLHLSARSGNEEITRMLLNKGADVHAKQKNGFTALHLATQKGDKAVVKLLLEYGAKVDVHAKQKDGFTALHLATQKGDKAVVKLLLEYGAKVDSKNGNDITPLHIAAEYGYQEIIEIILKFGADINCRDMFGRTALHIASYKGHTKVVANLLEYGSDINITSRDDQTPHDRAVDGIQTFFIPTYYDSDGPYDSDEEPVGYVPPRVNPCKDTAEALECHIVKMKTANLHVSEKNSQSVSSSAAMIDFRDECEEEIAGMKNEKINNTNVSFYDILAKRTSSSAIYMRNENIVQVLKSDDYKRKFPIYASMIESHFRKSMERKEFLEQGNKIFHFLFPELPYNCSEKIFSYLRDEDLRILIDACKPLSISNPDTNINDAVIT